MSLSMEQMYTKVSSSFGFEVEEREKTWYEKLESEVCGLCPSMTWSQRIWGCMICMIAGFFVAMGSMFNFAKLVGGDPIPFALQYTAGNILSLSSTCFLYGPLAQAKSMFATTRLFTTVIYFTLMGATLFLGIIFLVIFLSVSLQFVPFSRKIGHPI